MSLDLALFAALKQAGVPDDAATRVAEELDAAIERRVKDAQGQLATKLDVTLLQSDIERAKADVIKWTAGFVLGGSALTSIAIAVVLKVLHAA